MKFVKAMCALALLSSTAGVLAYKVAAGSPEAICVERGHEPGSPEFKRCVAIERRLQAGEKTSGQKPGPTGRLLRDGLSIMAR